MIKDVRLVVCQLTDWHLSVEFAFFDLVVIFLSEILLNFVGKNFLPSVVSVKTYLSHITRYDNEQKLKVDNLMHYLKRTNALIDRTFNTKYLYTGVLNNKPASSSKKILVLYKPSAII